MHYVYETCNWMHSAYQRYIMYTMERRCSYMYLWNMCYCICNKRHRCIICIYDICSWVHYVYHRCFMCTMKRRCIMYSWNLCYCLCTKRRRCIYVFVKLAIGCILYTTDASCIPWNVDALWIDETWRHYVYHSLTWAARVVFHLQHPHLLCLTQIRRLCINRDHHGVNECTTNKHTEI